MATFKVVRWGLPQFSIRGPTGPRAACGVSKYSVALHQPRWLANSSPARYARPASALSQPSHSHARVDRVDDQLRAMRAAEHVFDRGGFAAAMCSVALRAKSKRECAVCELERGKEEVYSALGDRLVMVTQRESAAASGTRSRTSPSAVRASRADAYAREAARERACTFAGFHKLCARDRRA